MAFPGSIFSRGFSGGAQLPDFRVFPFSVVGGRNSAQAVLEITDIPVSSAVDEFSPNAESIEACRLWWESASRGRAAAFRSSQIDCSLGLK